MVDAYCESIAFSATQCERLFTAASAHGWPVRLHAEQISNIGGSRMAARHGALACDHLEYATEGDTIELARAGTVLRRIDVAGGPANFRTERLREDELAEVVDGEHQADGPVEGAPRDLLVGAADWAIGWVRSRQASGRTSRRGRSIRRTNSVTGSVSIRAAWSCAMA